MIPDEEFLTVEQVLRKIEKALEQKKSFSLVRVGDGENIILAQDSILTIKQVLKKKWAKKANKGEKGVHLPNLKLRNQMVKAIKKATVVGIPFWGNDPIKADEDIKRPLTEAVFSYFDIKPKRICHTFVNRVLSQKREFWNLLRGKRVVLIGGWAEQVQAILKEEPYGLNIVYIHPFSDYSQLEKTLKIIRGMKGDFDIALIACGVNAVVLSQKIAKSTKTVAIDFGKSLMFMVQKKAGLEHSSSKAREDMLP